MAFAGNHPESPAATPTPSPKARLAPYSPPQLNCGQSESGKISYELRGEEVGERELWLYPENHADAAVYLCDTEGWGALEMHFSPDDHWLIVQDGGASLGVSLRLFRRDKGVNFTEIKDADINGKAERMALKSNGLPAKEILDHRYVDVLGWSRDSKTVAVRIKGHYADRVSIRDWIGLYKVATGTFTFDLKEFDRDTVKMLKKD